MHWKISSTLSSVFSNLGLLSPLFKILIYWIKKIKPEINKILPALLTKISKRLHFDFIRSLKALTDFKLARSSISSSTLSLELFRMISLAAFSPLFLSRHAKMTCAPRLAKSKAVSYPMPQLAPVTIAVLPWSWFLLLHFAPEK